MTDPNTLDMLQHATSGQLSPYGRTSNTLPDGRMRPKEAAKYLGFEVGTLANWRMRANGPDYVKAGSRVFYFQQALDAWISENCEQPKPSAMA